MKNNGMWIAVTCLLAVAAGPVLASGFSIYEQSAKASGQAGAWVARADDAAAVWYNPASMVRLDGMNLQLGMNLITVGSDTELLSNDENWGLTAPTKFETEREDVTPLHLYFTHKISDRIAWGLGINNPFGLVSSWEDQPVTLSHRRAELHTFLVNPNVAFAVNDNWSLAVGLTYLYADIKEFSRDIDQAPLLEPLPGPMPENTIGRSDLTGDGDDWGWDIALLYKTDEWSFGFTFRSELSPDIEGNVAFTDIDPLLREGGAYGIDLFPSGPGSAALDLPAQAAIGAAWNVSDVWTLEFDITWAGWSSFEELAIDFENETEIPGVFIPVVQDEVRRQDWNDTNALRLGSSVKLAENHELRFGALVDQAPVPRHTLRPSIPDSDRKAVTFGYGLKAGNFNLDFYYMPLWFDEVYARGDFEEGVIDGTYTSFTHLAGVTANVKF
jgi:long-chain fatty acid transport protein